MDKKIKQDLKQDMAILGPYITYIDINKFAEEYKTSKEYNEPILFSFLMFVSGEDYITKNNKNNIRLTKTL